MYSEMSLNLNRRRSSAADPTGMTKVKIYHRGMITLLEQMDSKLSTLSSHVDKEFLAAYRVHMLSVQSELKSLKHDVTKGEQMLNSDSQVAKLETEMNWFSEEVGRLRIHHESMTKDSQQMKQRLVDMIEQRSFLCDQLKALLKRNKVLEIEIQQLTGTSDLLSLQSISPSLASAGQSLQRSMQLQQQQRQKQLQIAEERRNLVPFQAARQQHGRQRFESTEDLLAMTNVSGGGSSSWEDTDRGNDSLPRSAYMQEKDDAAFHDLPEDTELVQLLQDDDNSDDLFNGDDQQRQFDVEEEERYQFMPGQLPPLIPRPMQNYPDRLLSGSPHSRHRAKSKTQPRSRSPPIASKNGLNTNLAYETQARHLAAQRSRHERELQEVIHSVFGEIQQRRQSSKALSTTRTPSQLEQSRLVQTSTFGEDHGRLQRLEPYIQRRGGLTGLGLDQFNDGDRFAAIVKFLSRPKVFAATVQRLSGFHEENNNNQLDFGKQD